MLIKGIKNVLRNKCVRPKPPFVFTPPNTTIFYPLHGSHLHNFVASIIYSNPLHLSSYVQVC